MQDNDSNKDSVTGESKNFFDKFGLEVTSGDVEVGKTYPIFGMITKFLDEEPDTFEVEINYNIKAKMVIPDPSKIELLRGRIFEPGIFISTIRSTEDSIKVDCKTVVFGKKREFDA